ncbi:hypothetical protein CF386_07665 [Paraphotobacterium marinum]|uniref:Conjugal transfer protein TraT n=1 Tax=Paraphotobacterium marinum TaxID=1755811 RepID=A0A220VF08_9GAMM|nr:complement resistance protein TraT [Paraphotobacterium marinum]ASK78937.1 hypothetical protein CF386_07665 [Paraphotobacterium marinum]
MKKIIIKSAVISLLSLNLVGCSAISTAINHHDLEVDSKLSDTVWLQPTNQKTVYIQSQDTTGKSINISHELKDKIEEKGYRIVNNPDKAQFILQVNTKKIAKMSDEQMNGFLSQGFQDSAGGVALGASTIALAGGDANSIVAGGLVGGVASTVADDLVTDEKYVLVTDVRIQEKTKGLVHNQTGSHLKNGSSSYNNSTSFSTSHRQIYQTRIVTFADQVNLKLSEAKKPIENNLTNSLAGFFA